MVWILENPVSMVENLLTAASTDPLSAVLVAMGAVVIGASSAALGGLALGAFFDALVPDTATTRQRRAR